MSEEIEVTTAINSTGRDYAGDEARLRLELAALRAERDALRQQVDTLEWRNRALQWHLKMLTLELEKASARLLVHQVHRTPESP